MAPISRNDRVLTLQKFLCDCLSHLIIFVVSSQLNSDVQSILVIPSHCL